jgi:hypothetical protein
LALDQFFALRDTTLAQILDTAGPMPNHATGIISLLTERILGLVDDIAFDNIGTWQPESILSGATRQARRSDPLD